MSAKQDILWVIHNHKIFNRLKIAETLRKTQQDLKELSLRLTTPDRGYVYILEEDDERYYIGSTRQIRTRLTVHKSTGRKFRVWSTVLVAERDRLVYERWMLGLAQKNGWNLSNRYFR